MIKRLVALSLLFAPSAHAKDYGQWDGYGLTGEQKAQVMGGNLTKLMKAGA